MSKSQPPYKRHPVAVAGILVLMIFGVLYGVAVFFGYAPNIVPILLNPVVGISIAVVFVLVLLIGGAYYIANRGSGGIFGGGSKADQLTKLEADVLATRWHRNRGYLARKTPLDGIDYVESGNDGGEENYARIYEKVIVPKKDANRKCILINLEQSVAVDIDDSESIDQAIEGLNDAMFFSEEAVGDFAEARKEYKQNLAGSSPGETEIVEKPDGSVIRRNVQERTVSSPEPQNPESSAGQQQEG